MALINENYLKLKAGYLFPEIRRRVAAFEKENPSARVIRMGIGDVTEPLPAAARQAMHQAVDDLGRHETFHGYGPEQGYDFLREAIAKNDFAARGCEVAADEIFVSDGSKCDCGNILDIFGPGNRVAITDPAYPVYVDSNVMAGHTGEAKANGEYDGLLYVTTRAESNFTAEPPGDRVDLAYLCSPNNPTGTVMSRELLGRWVEYAKSNGTVLLFDAAYEAYITDPAMVHSIYEIPGVRDVAIEFRSFSKLAGFTGVRCGFTVVPKSLKGKRSNGEAVELHKLWHRRQSTKFNGVSYITQRGAAAVYTDEGKKQVRGLIDFYLANAAIIRRSMQQIGLTMYGGVNAPYAWIKTPDGMSSWEFFDYLLTHCHIVGTPGSGFGAAGEGYFRLSCFNSRHNVEEAMERLRTKLKP